MLGTKKGKAPPFVQLDILILVFPKDTCCHRKGESAPTMERTKKTEKQRLSWILE